MAPPSPSPSAMSSRPKVAGRTFILLASLALFVDPSLSSSPASAPRSHIRGISRRLDGEHVTLSDCRDKSNVFSSQAAYFPGEPGPTPQDVSVITTEPGQAALWINTNTTALFTGTSVKFTATLGPKVSDGEFAGTGENGYTTFTCWQEYKPNLYEYDKTTCSQVYDCNHDPMPSALPTSSPTSSPAGSGGLAKGAQIGIAVGAVGAFLFLIATVAVCWYWRKIRKQNSDAERPTNNPEPAAPFPPHMPFPASGDVGKVQTMAETRYEMDGRWYRVEMSCEHGKVELDTEGVAQLPANEIEINEKKDLKPYEKTDLKVDEKTDVKADVRSFLTDSPTLTKTDPAPQKEPGE
ncbi:hypothetical protein QBC43DRAFT_321936 [Cladorrhinum sp. PSN259]|nr:hypothetical protein QBC43DRAFT_321936 [Cladorrhinum sp. PSN259]